MKVNLFFSSIFIIIPFEQATSNDLVSLLSSHLNPSPSELYRLNKPELQYLDIDGSGLRFQEMAFENEDDINIIDAGVGILIKNHKISFILLDSYDPRAECELSYSIFPEMSALNINEISFDGKTITILPYEAKPLNIAVYHSAAPDIVATGYDALDRSKGLGWLNEQLMSFLVDVAECVLDMRSEADNQAGCSTRYGDPVSIYQSSDTSVHLMASVPSVLPYQQTWDGHKLTIYWQPLTEIDPRQGPGRYARQTPPKKKTPANSSSGANKPSSSNQISLRVKEKGSGDGKRKFNFFGRGRGDDGKKPPGHLSVGGKSSHEQEGDEYYKSPRNCLKSQILESPYCDGINSFPGKPSQKVISISNAGVFSIRSNPELNYLEITVDGNAEFTFSRSDASGLSITPAMAGISLAPPPPPPQRPAHFIYLQNQASANIFPTGSAIQGQGGAVASAHYDEVDNQAAADTSSPQEPYYMTPRSALASIQGQGEVVTSAHYNEVDSQAVSDTSSPQEPYYMTPRSALASINLPATDNGASRKETSAQTTAPEREHRKLFEE